MHRRRKRASNGVPFEGGLVTKAEVLRRSAGREPCGSDAADRGPGRCFSYARSFPHTGVVLNLVGGIPRFDHQVVPTIEDNNKGPGVIDQLPQSGAYKVVVLKVGPPN